MSLKDRLEDILRESYDPIDTSDTSGELADMKREGLLGELAVDVFDIDEAAGTAKALIAGRQEISFTFSGDAELEIQNMQNERYHYPHKKRETE